MHFKRITYTGSNCSPNLPPRPPTPHPTRPPERPNNECHPQTPSPNWLIPHPHLDHQPTSLSTTSNTYECIWSHFLATLRSRRSSNAAAAHTRWKGQAPDVCAAILPARRDGSRRPGGCRWSVCKWTETAMRLTCQWVMNQAGLGRVKGVRLVSWRTSVQVRVPVHSVILRDGLDLQLQRLRFFLLFVYFLFSFSFFLVFFFVCLRLFCFTAGGEHLSSSTEKANSYL